MVVCLVEPVDGRSPAVEQQKTAVLATDEEFTVEFRSVAYSRAELEPVASRLLSTMHLWAPASPTPPIDGGWLCDVNRVLVQIPSNTATWRPGHRQSKPSTTESRGTVHYTQRPRRRPSLGAIQSARAGKDPPGLAQFDRRCPAIEPDTRLAQAGSGRVVGVYVLSVCMAELCCLIAKTCNVPSATQEGGGGPGSAGAGEVPREFPAASGEPRSLT
jgi:hypothetical protein